MKMLPIALLSLVLWIPANAQTSLFENWTPCDPKASSDFLNDVTFADGRFVAVGLFGSILTSANGVDWIMPHPGSSANLTAILHGNGRFVTAAFSYSDNSSGPKKAFLTSANGLDWIANDLSIRDGVGLAFGNGRFLALVDRGETVLTSTDGTVWVSQKSGLTNVIGFAYGNGQFAVTSYPSTIYTSVDGSDWVLRYFDAETYLDTLTFAGGRFLVYGSPRSDIFDHSPLLSSIDGVSWARDSGLTNCLLRLLDPNEPHFDANDRLLSCDTSNDVQSISNAGTWIQTLAEVPGSGFAYGNGLFVAVRFGIRTSGDGTNWVRQPRSPEKYFATLTYGNGRFVAVTTASPDQTNSFWTSTAQGSWIETRSEIPGQINGMAFSNGQFVAVGGDYSSPEGDVIALVITSTDGINWIRRSVDEKGETFLVLTKVAFGNGRFVALGTDGGQSSVVFTSDDGISWVRGQSDFLPPASFGQANTYGLTYGGGQFVAVGGDYFRQTNSFIFTSTDGIHWTERNSPSPYLLRGITFASGQFVAVGASLAWPPAVFTDGAIVTSTNGIDWVLRASGRDYAFHDVTYGNGYFVAVNGNNIATSNDGIQWQKHVPSFAEFSPFSPVAFGDGRFVIAGSRSIFELNTVVSLSLIRDATSLISISLTAPPGPEYTVESSADLIAWQTVTNFTTAAEITQIEIPLSDPHRAFFRAVLSN